MVRIVENRLSFVTLLSVLAIFESYALINHFDQIGLLSLISGFVLFSIVTLIFCIPMIVTDEDLEVSLPKNLYKIYHYIVFAIVAVVCQIFYILINKFGPIVWVYLGICLYGLLFLCITLLFVAPETGLDYLESIRFFCRNLSWRVIWTLLCWLYSTEGIRHYWDHIRRQANSKLPICWVNLFQCRLDLKRVPEEALQRLDSSLKDVIVNPSFLFYSGRDVKHTNSFQPTREQIAVFTPIRWTQSDSGFYLLDPGTELVFKYGSGDYEQVLKSLEAGKEVKGDLDDNVIKLLKFANVLVHKDYWKQRKMEWEKKIDELKIQMRTHGFVVLKDVIPPLQMFSLQHYHKKNLEYYLESKKSQITDSCAKYLYRWNDPVALMLNTFLSNLARKISEKNMVVGKTHF